MKNILDQYIKNKVKRVIDFCESEGIELFSFTDLETDGDYSVEFNLDCVDNNLWELEVTIQYLNFMKDEEEIKEDEEYFYIIKNGDFTQVESFEADLDEEDEIDEEE